MDCHECESHLLEYLSGELPAALADRVRAELSVCASCAALKRQLERGLMLAAQLPVSAAPPALHARLRAAAAAQAEHNARAASPAGARGSSARRLAALARTLAGAFTRSLKTPQFAALSVLVLLVATGTWMTAPQRATRPGPAPAEKRPAAAFEATPDTTPATTPPAGADPAASAPPGPDPGLSREPKAHPPPEPPSAPPPGRKPAVAGPARNTGLRKRSSPPSVEPSDVLRFAPPPPAAEPRTPTTRHALRAAAPAERSRGSEDSAATPRAEGEDPNGRLERGIARFHAGDYPAALRQIEAALPALQDEAAKSRARLYLVRTLVRQRACARATDLYLRIHGRSVGHAERARLEDEIKGCYASQGQPSPPAMLDR